MGFAVTTPFEIANRQAAEPVYDIRMLSKHGGQACAEGCSLSQCSQQYR
jgi:hypothetical protein